MAVEKRKKGKDEEPPKIEIVDKTPFFAIESKRGRTSVHMTGCVGGEAGDKSVNEIVDVFHGLAEGALGAIDGYVKETESRVPIMIRVMHRKGGDFTEKEGDASFRNAFSELSYYLDIGHDRWVLMGEENRKKIKEALLTLIRTNHPNKWAATCAIPVENDDDSLRLFEAALGDPQIRTDAFRRLKFHSGFLDANYRIKIISRILASLSEEKREDALNDGFVALDELATAEVVKAMPELKQKLTRLKDQNPAISDSHTDQVYYALSPEKKKAWLKRLEADFKSEERLSMARARRVKWEDIEQTNLFFNTAYRPGARREFHDSIRNRIPQMTNFQRLNLINKLIELSPKEESEGALGGICETFQKLVWDKGVMAHDAAIETKIDEAEKGCESHKKHREELRSILRAVRISLHAQSDN